MSSQGSNTTTVNTTVPTADLSGAPVSQDQPKGYIEVAKDFVAVQLDTIASTIAPASTTTNSKPVPVPPHGIPPTNEHSALVAEEDKSLQLKAAETYEHVKEVATHTLQAATEKVSEISQTVIGATTSVISNPTPILTGISDATVATYNSTAATLSQAGVAVGLTSNIKPGVTPEAPHGVAPSDLEKGIVSDQDKTIIQKSSERIEGAKKVVAEYADTANQVVREQVGSIGQTLSENYAVVKDATVATYNSTAATLNQAGVAVGLTSNIKPGVTPEAPHGVAPTNYNHGGLVSEQDKTIVQKSGERLQQTKEVAVEKLGQGKEALTASVNYASQTISENYAAVVDTTAKTAAQIQESINNASAQVGLTPKPVQPGVTPEAPHGVAPTNYNHGGVVSEQDKNLLQKGSEKLEEVKKTATVYADTTNQAVKEQVTQLNQALTENYEQLKDATVKTAAQVQDSVNQASAQIGLTPKPVQPGVTPEAPHGVAPTNFHGGVVSEQDKNLIQKTTERYEEARDLGNKKFEEAVQQTKEVAAQYADTTNQVVKEQVDQIKDATAKTAAQVQDSVNQASAQIGLTPKPVQPGVTPEAPHGVAPTNFHGGVVSEQDKNLLQKGSEKLEEAKKVASQYADTTNQVVKEQVDQIKDATAKTAAQVQDSVNQASAQIGLTPKPVQPGVTPEAPHGVAPTNYNHGGLVSEQDKTLLQKGSEKLEEVKVAVAAKVEDAKVGLQGGNM